MTTIGLTLIIFGVSGILTAVFLKLCLKYILVDPPNVALITFLGKRWPWKKDEIPWWARPFIPKKAMKKEGWRFFFPYFPFFYNFILIKVNKVNQKIELEDIRCKLAETDSNSPQSGGEVSVKVDLTWHPDYIHENGERLRFFINSGREEEVKKILHGMTEEDIRQLGRTHTWEEYTFATDELTKSIYKKLTGQVIKDINAFQRETENNGVPDIISLGIVITRINVGKIKEQGELQKAASSQAKEIQERRGDLYETETEIQQAQLLFEAYKKVGTPKTLEECILEIRRRKVIREGHGAVYDIPELEKVGVAIGNIIRR